MGFILKLYFYKFLTILILVLQDIDGLKKSKEGARNAIKWLESEFQKGNRFLRTQRENESMSLPLLKIPSKLGKLFYNIKIN